LPGPDGRVYLTDSLPMAERYAMWGAAASATQGGPVVLGDSAVATRARELGGHVGIVALVKRNSVKGLNKELGSVAPPLPWQTSMELGTSFFTTAPVPSPNIHAFQVFRVEQLDSMERSDITAQVDRIAAAFRRDFESPGSSAPAASARLREEVDLARLLTAAVEPGESQFHGLDHSIEVAGAGVRLLEAGSDADPAVLLAFSVLHDSRRMREGLDPEHGQRAAILADQLVGDGLELNEIRMQLLRDALRDHDLRETSDDATIGACWDADRLTLTRRGVEIDREAISTEEGRRLIGSDRLPCSSATDWEWIGFQYEVAAALQGLTEAG